jgi:hypothetical protein
MRVHVLWLTSLDPSKVTNKENWELMHMVGRRLREAVGAEQALPEAIRQCLEVLQTTETPQQAETTPSPARPHQTRRLTLGRRSHD